MVSATVNLHSCVADLFAGDESWQLPTVGVELELLPMSFEDAATSIAPIHDTRAALIELADIGFEPGGQVELHPPPATTATEAISRVERLRSEARRHLGARGLELVAIGLDPWGDAGEVPLQIPSPRYQAMDAHYARIGPEGRCFMRQTASTQICVGLRPGAEGTNQWRAANLIAPLLAASFANAPMRWGRGLGHNGERTAVAARADPRRHRLDWTIHPPAQAYEAFALNARRIRLDPRRPTSLDSHLTTLFPPVRPRGSYLEVRSVDALDPADLEAAVVLTTAILASPWAVSAVLTALDSTLIADRNRWSRAADLGIRDHAMALEALIIVDIASEAIRSHLDDGYLPAAAPAILASLRERIVRQRTPGDDAVDRIASGDARRVPYRCGLGARTRRGPSR